MKDKELAISETIRLIKTNHNVNDNIEKVLSEIYDLGYYLGTLRVKCNNHKKHPDYKKFNSERDLESRVKDIEPIRVSNVRDLKYNGPEIGNYHLVTDLTFNQALKDMSYEDTSYKYFNSKIGDEKAYLSRLESAYDEEEKGYITTEYNELEVNILLCKLFQVAHSVAYEETFAMPEPVKDFFRFKSNTEEMEKDGMDVENMKKYLVSYEKEVSGNYPNYKDWSKYYFK